MYAERMLGTNLANFTRPNFVPRFKKHVIKEGGSESAIHVGGGGTSMFNAYQFLF